MSAKPISDNNTLIANSENNYPQQVSDENTSPLDSLPEKLVHLVLEQLPHHSLKTPKIGPYLADKRLHQACTAVFKRQSFQSPKSSLALILNYRLL